MTRHDDFAGALRRLRDRAGLTQQALADRAGISRKYLSELERGLQQPSWPVVLGLAAALGCRTDDFRRA